MATYTPLLPCINRNIINAFDTNNHGLVAYGSRSSIYVLDFRGPTPKVWDSEIIRNAHKGKVTAVSFCKKPEVTLIASVGEDEILRIFDIAINSCIARIGVEMMAKPAITWLHDSMSTLLYASTCGTVIKFNSSSKRSSRIKTGSETIVLYIACNALQPELVGFGHKSGRVSVVNVITTELLHTLQSHSSEIRSLMWSTMCPDMLLSTSEESARIWKLGEDRPVRSYYPPSGGKQDDRRKIKLNCSIFHPFNPDVIICSSFSDRGTVGSVTFKGSAVSKFSAFATEDVESYFKENFKMSFYNLFINGKMKVYMLTADFQKFSLWDVCEEKLVRVYYFLNGPVFRFSISPINPNLLAVCCGDGVFRIWDTSSPSPDLKNIHYFGCKMEIKSAAWHPVDENIVAFGTEEGGVGIIDAFKKRIILQGFESRHKRAVYSMQWGPCCKAEGTEDSTKLFLYSCGGNIILINDPSKPKESALQFETLIQYPSNMETFPDTSSYIAWKSDFSCIAVGSYEGHVDLFSDKFVFLSRYTVKIKTTELIEWHPLCTFQSPSASPFKSWVAVTGNGENIHILDTSILCPDGNSDSGTGKILSGHKKKVCSVCWSPHVDGQLVSVSKDGTVQVWNVVTTSLIVNYAYHHDIVYAAYWSVTDPDVICSGGRDYCIRQWRISEQKESTPPQRSTLTKYRKAPKNRDIRKFECESIEAANGHVTEPKSDVSKDEKSEKVAQEDTPEVTVAHKKKNKSERAADKPASSQRGITKFFHLFKENTYSKEQQYENILKLVDIMSEEDDSDILGPPMYERVNSEELGILGFFMDQMSAMKMVTNKATKHLEAGQKDHACYLGILTSNTEVVLKNAAKNRCLTDFLLGQAPTVSRNFWLDMCEKYADQLFEDQNYSKASAYYMACGNKTKAIRTLSENGRLVDALAFARATLPETDALVIELLKRCAREFSTHNRIEEEVQCYLALNDPAQAAKILHCAQGSKYSYAATYICKNYRLKEEKIYAYSCFEKCLVENDWTVFYKMAEQVDSVKVYTTLVRAHELIQNHIKLYKKDGLAAKDIFGKKESKTLIWSGRVIKDGNQCFLTHVFNTLRLEGILPTDKDSLRAIYEAVLTLEQKRKKSEVPAEAHIYTAICVTQMIVTSALEDFGTTSEYFNKIFYSSYRVAFLPKTLCWLFLPVDIYWNNDEKKLQAFVKCAKSEDNMHCIYESFCNTFTNIDSSSLKTYAIDDVSDSHLEAAVMKVDDILSQKKVEDSLLLYFVANYISELKRLTKKNCPFKCYHTATDKYTESVCAQIDSAHTNSNDEKYLKMDVLDKITESVDSEIDGDHTDSNNVKKDPSDKSTENVDPEIDSAFTERHNAEEDEVQKLIILALEEAKEKSLVLESRNKVEEHGHNSTADISNGKIVIDENLNVKTGVLNKIDKFSDDIFAVTVENKLILETKDTENGVITENGLDNKNSWDETNVKEAIYNLHVDDASQNCNGEAVKKSVSMKSEKMEISTDDDAPHDICCSDVKLLYMLIKCLASVLCKDEYGLLYYLKTCLADINVNISQLNREQSTKSRSLNLSAKKNNLDVNQAPAKTVLQSAIYQLKTSEDLECKDETLTVEHNNKIHLENVSVMNSSNSRLLKSEVVFSQVNDSKKEPNLKDINVLYSSSELQKCENVLDQNGYVNGIHECFSGSADNSQRNGDAVSYSVTNGEVNEKLVNGVNDVSDKSIETCTSVELSNGLSSVDSISYAETQEISGVEQVKTLKDLQDEHKQISSHIKYLESREFYYPNPFDAASDIIGICYDLFQKNPCLMVKAEFHSLAEDIIIWRKKYCSEKKDKSLALCQICNNHIC